MSLPEFCYGVDPTDDGKVIMIKKGVKGYIPTDIKGGEKVADKLNERFGITKPQEEAMIAGSMFGWDVPAADPSLYEKE